MNLPMVARAEWVRPLVGRASAHPEIDSVRLQAGPASGIAPTPLALRAGPLQNQRNSPETAMGRRIAAVVVGIVVAFSLVFCIELIGHRVYPAPADLDFHQPDVVAKYMQTLPVGAFLFVLGGFALATLGGGFVAARIAGDRPYLFAGIIGALMLAATIANLMMIPHPLWFSVSAIALIVGAMVLAGRLAK
jgi:hypothetical protein